MSCCSCSVTWFFCSSKDCSLPGSSVHGILQARILERVARPSSRRSSRPRDQIHVCLHLLHCRRNSLSTKSPQFSSVAQLCQTLCDPTDCSTPSFPIHHQLQKLTQTHVHRVSNAIQNISSSIVPFFSRLQSFPASESSPMRQLFAWGGQSIGASASVLPVNIQDWFPLGWTGCISLQSKELWRVFSNTTVWKHQFFSTQPSLWSNFLDPNVCYS